MVSLQYRSRPCSNPSHLLHCLINQQSAHSNVKAFLTKLERTKLTSVIDSFGYYNRHMDDLFCLSDATGDFMCKWCLTEVTRQHVSKPNTKWSHLLFLDVSLTCLNDGRVQRNVRRGCWYAGFDSFVSIQQNRNPAKCSAFRTKKIRLTFSAMFP